MGLNRDAEDDMDRDVRDNPGLYEALAANADSDDDE